MKIKVGVLVMVAMLALLVIAGPLVTIWCLNTLFPALSIAYTWETWLASLILTGVFGNRFVNRNDD